MILYTIGFTQKRAETFFELLRQNSVQRVIDIRISPDGQFAGFTKQSDLPYFLSKLVQGCQYIHMLDLAPTKEILADYRTDSNWPRYVERFETLMDERKIPWVLDQAEFEKLISCLLCSEPTPERCHRRLVAERIAMHWPKVDIIHL